MVELLEVRELRQNCYMVVFREEEGAVKAWFASPKYSVLLDRKGHSAGNVTSTSQITFNLETRNFHISSGLKGGGCTFSNPISSNEPEVPASSPEQRDISLRIKSMHQYQQENDWTSAFHIHLDLTTFLRNDFAKPFAMLRTLIEAYSSLDWNGKLCTAWILVHIKELLDKVYLSMVLEKQAIAPSSKQYLKQLMDIILEQDERNMRLDLYLKLYLQIIMSGLEAIASNVFPQDEELIKQIANTLKLLQGQNVPSAEIVGFSADIYKTSLFHRALSIEVAAALAKSQGESGLDYLLTFLRRDAAVPWNLRYLAMLKLAHLLKFVDPLLQRRVVEGHLPKSQGLIHLLGVTEGDDAWVIRSAAFHSFLFISTNPPSDEIHEIATTSLEGAKAAETDDRVKNFMRQSASLQKLSDPTVEEFIDQPTQYLMTFPSGVGRAYLADLNMKSVSIFEKDFLHGSSRVIITKKNMAIVTGGADHPTHSYEVSLVTGEYLRMPELNEGRYWHAVTSLDNVIYITGGRNKREVLRSVECYKSGKWELLSPMNMPRDSHNAVTENRKIYVFGGTGSEDSTNSIEVLSEGEWTILPVRLPEPRTSPALLFITPSKVLIAGGKYQKDRKEVWQLDMESGAVQELPKLPASCSFTSNPVSVRNGFVYMLSSEEQELLQFDLIEHKWEVYPQ